ncbi:MAG TPA: glycosyltransferase [Casimicrobiaceae bacterium]
MTRVAALRARAAIIVIVIARDEAPAVAGFFAQWQPLTRDFCLLDTGSTDDTIAVARAMGVRVESARFDNFAAARNEAIDRFGGGADWIVMLDLDERLDAHTIANAEALLHCAPYDILLAPVISVYADGTRCTFTPKAFLFRHDPALRWVFSVHEKLVGSRRQALVRNATIDHMMALHTPERRVHAAASYDALMQREPYFIDAAYRQRMIERWHILDHLRVDDARIAKIACGPLISVVVPTYGRRALLKAAVRSALAQDYVNVEVLVVADHDPAFGAIVDDLAGDARVHLHNLARNHGAGGAVPRNHALQIASGDYIAYLDDDNEWEPEHLSSIYEAMRSSGAAFGFSSMQVDGTDLFFSRPELQGIDTSCVLHQRELIRRHGGWKDRAVDYAHDWELFARWVHAGETWVCTRRPTLRYGTLANGQAPFIAQLAQARRRLHDERASREAERRVGESRAIDSTLASQQRWSARSALVSRAPQLAELCPGVCLHAVDLGGPAAFTASSASFACTGEGYFGIVVGATLAQAGGDTRRDAAAGASQAQHFAVTLAADFALKVAHSMREDAAPAGFTALGECVLVRWREQWWCVAATRSLGVDAREASALLRLDEALAITQTHPMRGFADTLPQQGFMPIAGERMRMLYSLGPTIIVDASAADGSFVVESGADPGIAIEHWRGASPLIRWGTGYLGLALDPAPSPQSPPACGRGSTDDAPPANGRAGTTESPRPAQRGEDQGVGRTAGAQQLRVHRFVALDARCDPTAASDAFTFGAAADESAAGLAPSCDGARLVASFAAGGKAWLAAMPVSAVRTMLRPLPVAVRRPPSP